MRADRLSFSLFTNARRTRLALAAVAGAALFSLFSLHMPQGQVSLPQGEGADMPEFSSTSQAFWINSKPLKRAGLRGKVVLLEVWTSV